MYFFLTEAIKRRFVLELRRYWMYHPKYRDIVDHIQMKYSFRERPQYGIVLKSSSANQVVLSADNFQGTVMSYIHLAKVENYPGLSVEWVREDARAIQNNGGVFPSSPGIYYIDLTSAAEFYVDPLLDATDESVTKVSDTSWQLQHSFLNGTLRLYEMPSSIPLEEGVNYTADPSTGDITLVQGLTGSRYLSADYRYPGTSTGPWAILENHSQNTAIPGVVLAFGRRMEAGDRLAVVVQDRRQPSALEYGGRWEINIDFDIIARDPYSQMELADQTVLYLFGVARNRLSTEGIEITNVSMGGESEEVYDENADDYYYNASISVTVQTDWSIQVPLTATIRRVTPQTSEQQAQVAAQTDDELADNTGQTSFHLAEGLGLQSLQDPFFAGRTATYEVIR